MNEAIQVACAACLTSNRILTSRLGENPACGKCGAALLDGVPVDLGEEGFETFVARTQLPIVADFWAPWCGPCRAMAPHFAHAAAQLKVRARFVKVNTEDAPGLAARFGIRAIPTIVLFRDGAEAKRASGAMDSESLARWLS